MMTQQQIIGVSDRLGANLDSMQGTTRAIYDSQPGLAAAGTRRFFENVQTRPYPFSNISQNRFETGESLAIESIALVLNTNANFVAFCTSFFGAATLQVILNLYIGNQRVLKDFDLTYCLNQIGTTNTVGNDFTGTENFKAVVYLESPIVIPPLIEFYADLTTSAAMGNVNFSSINLILQGTGTLLNTQKNF
jgi:hypothetical protein